MSSPKYTEERVNQHLELLGSPARVYWSGDVQEPGVPDILNIYLHGDETPCFVEDARRALTIFHIAEPGYHDELTVAYDYVACAEALSSLVSEGAIFLEREEA